MATDIVTPQPDKEQTAQLKDMLGKAKSVKDWAAARDVSVQLAEASDATAGGYYLEAAAAATSLLAFDQAAAYLELASRHIASANDRERIRLGAALELNSQKLHFLLRNDIGHTLDRLKSDVGKRGGTQDAVALEASIMGALQARRPYHMLRLGDGEGVILGGLNNLEFPVACQQAAKANLNIWFGKDNVAVDDFLIGIRDPILGAIANADAVGVPSAGPVRYCWKSDHRGYLGFSAIIDHIDRLERDTALTDSHVNIAMQQQGRWANILSSVDKVAVVTCHPQLAELLKTRFDNIREVKTYLVPARVASSGLFGSAVDEPHYPNVYRKLLSEMEGDMAGVLCINAAGFLGKIYGDKLKRLGAVVVDTGSVADYWLGYRSRDFANRIPEEEWKKTYMF